MMEQPSSSGEWRRWGEVRSGIDVIGLRLSAEVNLLGWGEGMEGVGGVYAIVSVLIYGFSLLLFDPVCSCSAERGAQRCRSEFSSLRNSSRIGFWLFPLKTQCASG